MENNNIDLTNANALDEDFSNFRIFGIGKQTEKQKINQQRRKDFRKDLKTELKGKDKWKALLTLSQRYNPAAAIPRAGVLAGARVNIFGISVRLYPAFLTPEEAKKKKIRVDAIAPAQKAWDRVSKFWRGLGGNPESLKKAVLNGYNKPVFKWTKSSKKRIDIAKNGFDGSVSVISINDKRPMNYIPTRLPMGDRLEDAMFNEPHENARYIFNPNELTPIYSKEGLIADGRVFLNSYGEYEFFLSANGDNQIEQWWESDEFSNSEAGAIAIAAGIGLLGSIAGMIADAGARKNPYEEGVNNQLAAEITQAEKEIETPTAEEMKKLEDAVKAEREMGLPPDDGSGADDKILGIPKTGFYIGIGLLALIGGFFAYKHFKGGLKVVK